jgi:tripartite-type tricarboxylate transporter receptor subunit TctC
MLPYWKGLRGAVFCIAAAFSHTAAQAQSSAEFYSGKQMSMIVPVPVGGGYDVYARFLARHLGKHIPGNPSIIVRNMPGAGGLIAANYLASIAPQDGLTLEIIASTITHKQLARSAGVQFDVRKFAWIGNMSVASSICALSGPAANLPVEDLFTKELVIGGTAGLPSVMPALLNGLAGTRFKVIEGYPSTPALFQAVEGGEINGLCGWGWDSARIIGKDLFKRGVMKVKLDVAIEPHPELQAMKVPFLFDYIPEGDRKEALKLALSTQVYNRAFAMGGDVPPDRLATIREAFTATLNDADALAEATTLGLEIRYLPPDEIAKVVEAEFSAPARIQNLALDELRKAGF